MEGARSARAQQGFNTATQTRRQQVPGEEGALVARDYRGRRRKKPGSPAACYFGKSAWDLPPHRLVGE